MEITLEVPDKHTARVLELLKGIKRVKIKSVAATPLTPAKLAFLAGLKESIEDVKRHQRGEIELQSWDELYAELQADMPADEAQPEIIKEDITPGTLKQSTRKRPAAQTS